jgi:serine/threonine-protein kinase
VLQVLGMGGMGEVRLVRDARLARDVALKMLRPDLRGHGGIEARFLHEVSIQGQLEHPGIVPVYELDFAPDGSPFFTMKRLGGRTLAQVLSQVRQGEAEATAEFPLHRLLSVFVSVCQAMEYAHARGVLHRDLKPSNMMVGEFGEVYILDWGLAKVREQAEHLRADPRPPELRPMAKDVTEAGAAMGTLGYLAPEQYRGDLGPHTEASDVYSLGAILFEIVVGRPLCPFKEVDSYAKWEADGRPLQQVPLGMDVPPELESLWREALAFEPHHRLGTVKELRQRLEKYLAGDRDMAKRRELAREHAGRAETAMASPWPTGVAEVEARKRALQEVSRSLVLDPDNPAARALLLRLLTSPLEQMPQDVIEERDRLADEQVRKELRLTSLTTLTPVLFFPVVMAAGIANWAFALGMLAAWVVFSAACWLTARAPGRLRWRILVPLMAGQLAMLSLVPVAGSMFFATYLLSLLMAISSIHAVRRHHGLSVLCTVVGFFSVLAPLVIEQSNVWPSAIEWLPSGDAVVIHARMIRFNPAVAPYVIAVLAAAFYVVLASQLWAINRGKKAMEDAHHMQLWQLRQLAPDATTEAQRRRPTEGAHPDVA